MKSTALQATLLHNPKASLSRWRADELVSALHEGGYDPSYHSTKEKGWKKAAAEAKGRLIVAGGDGTVAKVCKLPETDRHHIAILPTGGANNIATSFGIVGDPLELARDLQSLQTHVYRIGTVKGHDDADSFCEAVGVGALAAIAGMVDNDMERDAKRDAGRQAFREVLAEAEPIEIEMSLDGAPWNEPALMVEVLIISTIGPSLMLAPGRDPASDRLTIRWLSVEDREAMIEWLKAPEESEPPLKEASAHKVQIKTDQPMRIDDATFKKGGKVTLTLDGRHVDILVPPKRSETSEDAEPSTGAARAQS